MAVTSGEQIGRAIRLEHAPEHGKSTRAKKAPLIVNKARRSAKKALSQVVYKVKVLRYKEKNLVAAVSCSSLLKT